jgi:preprotein translocase subunit SecD
MKRITTSIIAVLFFSSLAQAVEIKSLTFNPVANQPLLTSQDFSEAHVVTKKGRVLLQATLTSEGSTKLKEYSLAHVGERLAIMSGDQIVAAPVIRVPMSQKLEIDALSKADAENMAHLINTK